MIDSVHYDHGKESFLEGLVECLEEAFPETWFQTLVKFILLDLLLHSNTPHVQQGKDTLAAD